jgi:hypothetical protein
MAHCIQSYLFCKCRKSLFIVEVYGSKRTNSGSGQAVAEKAFGEPIIAAAYLSGPRFQSAGGFQGKRKMKSPPVALP